MTLRSSSSSRWTLVLRIASLDRDSRLRRDHPPRMHVTCLLGCVCLVSETEINVLELMLYINDLEATHSLFHLVEGKGRPIAPESAGIPSSQLPVWSYRHARRTASLETMTMTMKTGCSSTRPLCRGAESDEYSVRYVKVRNPV